MATKPTFTDILRLQTSPYALAIFGVAALNACSVGDDNRESASSDMGTMGCPKVCYLSPDTFSEALQQPCSAGEDCPANQVCLAPPNAEDPIRQCSGDALVFRPCASGEDCTTDEVCRNSVCLTTCALASSCADGLDCVSVTGSMCDVGTQALVSEPVIDAGLDETTIDAEVDMATPDEIVPSCFVDKAVFETRFAGEPVAGLDNVWIGFDINADNRSELVTRETQNAGSRFVVWEGMPPTEVISLTAENLTNAEFMPNRWPSPPNYGVFDFDDKKAVYVVGRIGDDLVIRFFDIDTASSLRDINLGRDVESYKVLLHGKAPTVLVHRSDKKCSILRGLDGAELPLDEPDGGNCRLLPTWNSDGIGDTIDVIRYGSRGMELISVEGSGGQISVNRGLSPDALGFFELRTDNADTPTPLLIAASVRDGRLELSEIAIDIGLGDTPNTETAELLAIKAGPFVAQAVGDLGTFDMSRVEYFSSAPDDETRRSDLRIAIGFERRDMRSSVYVYRADILSLGPNEPVQLRASIKESQSLTRWSVAFDADGDGTKDLMGRIDEKIIFKETKNGRLLYELRSNPGRTIQPIWGPTSPPGPVSLDDCDGAERLVLQVNTPDANRESAASLSVRNEENTERSTSSLPLGQSHIVKITELDGLPPFEIIQVIHQTDGHGILRIQSAPITE